MDQNSPILQLRVALTTNDYQRLLNFYQDALGLEPAELWTTETSHGSLFWMGSASLEIFDEAHAAVVDEIEVGQRTAGSIRFALQVPDVYTALERVTAKGAKVVHPPKLTPWGDLNARIEDPDGMQITLFQTTGTPKK
jgi:predicted enzyme related to lactoylglutathione lyase